MRVSQGTTTATDVVVNCLGIWAAITRKSQRLAFCRAGTADSPENPIRIAGLPRSVAAASLGSIVGPGRKDSGRVGPNPVYLALYGTI